VGLCAPLKDNIIMDLSEIGKTGVDCTHPAEDKDHQQALGNTVINFLT
jgi:hypothetical protein